MKQDKVRVEVIEFKHLNEVPKELYSLRIQGYVEDTKDFDVGSVFGKEDINSYHVLIYIGDKLAAASAVGKAVHYPSIASKLQESGVEVSDDIWVDTKNVIAKDFRGKGIYHALIYSTYSFLRVQNAQKTVAFFPDDREIIAAKKYTAKPCVGISSGVHTTPDGKTISLTLHQMPEASYMCHLGWNYMNTELRESIVPAVIAQNFETHVMARVEEFKTCKFIQAILDQTLTKEQYIDAMGNNLKYVQWTTRLLGKMVGMTEDRELRNHYLHHLKGEVDHDVWIENDLEYLGADVEYYRDAKVPDLPISNFMRTQEAYCEFYRHPALFLAVPFTIEAFTAFMSQDVIDGLKQLISSWGYPKPEKGCTFFASHVHTDGHEEVGHWVLTKRMIEKRITDEKQACEFHMIIESVFRGIFDGFDQFAKKPSMISSQAQTTEGRKKAA